mgnify:CR=1 FL=1
MATAYSLLLLVGALILPVNAVAEQFNYIISKTAESGVPREEAVRVAIADAFFEGIFNGSAHEKINHTMPLMRTYKAIQEQEFNNWMILGIDTPTTDFFPQLRDRYTQTGPLYRVRCLMVSRNEDALETLAELPGNPLKAPPTGPIKLAIASHPYFKRRIEEQFGSRFELTITTSVLNAVKSLVSKRSDLVISGDNHFDVAIHYMKKPPAAFNVSTCSNTPFFNVNLYLDVRMKPEIAAWLRERVSLLSEQGYFDEVRLGYLKQAGFIP